MSATAAAVRAVRPGARRVPERVARLRVVAAPLQAGRRLPFVALCVALLLASLIAVLVVNIALSRGAYDVHQLQQRRTALAEREQQLAERLAIDSSPARLSERARELGMIPGTSPAFIRLSDGAVLGSPAPADPATAAAVSAIPTAVDLAAARALSEEAAAQQAATATASGAVPLDGGPVVPVDGLAFGQALPPETAEAEQAALEAARAAAAVVPAAPPLGDGAVAAGGTP